jgi:hypothetical protein
MKLHYATTLVVWFLLFPPDPYRVGPVRGWAEFGRYGSRAECSSAKQSELAHSERVAADSGVDSKVDPSFVQMEMAECRSSDDHEVKARQWMIDHPIWSLMIPLSIGKNEFEPNAPISEWRTLSSSDSPTGCEKEKEATVKKGNAILKTAGDKSQNALAAALAAATCISADDPRLRQNESHVGDQL